MGLFSRVYYHSLPPAPFWPAACLQLRVYVEASFAGYGPQLARFSRLQALHVQGGGATTIDTLPAKIGQLRTLKKLVLLNLPIDFPDWIRDLPNLHYLMVRGTDTTRIPVWIDELRHLRTLRVENCALTELPTSLRNMQQLRELGLRETRLHDFSADQFPTRLRALTFTGAGCYRKQDLAQLQQALKGTNIYPNPRDPKWIESPARPPFYIREQVAGEWRTVIHPVYAPLFEKPS